MSDLSSGVLYLEAQMGAVKQHQIREEGMRFDAEEVAVRAGVLTRCKVCGETTDAMTGDLEPAYRLANWLITLNDPLVASFGDDRRRLTDMIQKVVNDQGAECPCALRHDD